MGSEISKALGEGADKLCEGMGKDIPQMFHKLYGQVHDGVTGNISRTVKQDADSADSFDKLHPDGGLKKVEGDHGGTPKTGGDGQSVDDPLTHDEGGPTEHDGAGGSTVAGDPVDVVSGQMITGEVDVDLPGVLPLVLRRVYTTGYRAGGLFGPGWASTLDTRVRVDADGIHFADDDGRILHYPVPTQPGQRVLPAEGSRWPLVWDRRTDTVSVTDPRRGWTFEFAATATGPAAADGAQVRPLTGIADRNGNRIGVRLDEGLPAEVWHSGGYRVAVEIGHVAGGFRVEALRLLDSAGAAAGTAGADATGGAAGIGPGGAAGPGDGIVLRGFQYDPFGRLIGVANTAGAAAYFEWDSHDRICANIDLNGYRYEYRYDDEGRVVSGVGPDGFLSSSFDYDAESRSTKVTDSLGHTVEYRYDEHGRVVETIDGLGGVRRFERDRYGRLLAESDETGATVRYILDEDGNPARVEQPDGGVIESRFNAFGRPVLVTLPDGSSRSYSYDERGNLTGTVDPMGTAVSYGYDERGGLSEVVDALGAVTRLVCDAAGLAVSVTDPRGAVTAYPRDAFGRVNAVTGTFGGTTFTGWSPDGLMLWQQGVDGVRREWSYDAAGNPVEERDEAGGLARVEYGPFGTVTARVDRAGRRHEFEYDTELRLRSITGPDGRVWTYRHDEAGRLVEETDFDGHSTRFELDSAGRKVRRADEAGEIAFGYDGGGRLAWLDADGERSSLAYDRLGRMTRAQNDAGVLEIARDPLGRITAESWNGRTVSVERDAAGRIVRRTTPSGAVSEWAFDAAGLPTALRTAAGELVFERDAAGRETSRVLGDRAALSRSHDPAGRPGGQAIWALDGDPAAGLAAAAQGANPYRLVQQRVVDYRADGTPLRVSDLIRGQSDFELDADGRITRVTRGEHSETYTYNLLGAVSEASGSAATGGAISGGAASGDGDSPAGGPEAVRDRSATAGARQYEGYLLRRAGRTSYEYDAKGRLVHTCRRTLSGGELHWRYTWNSLGQLTGATTPDGTTWRYLYDPVGRRRAKQRLDADGEVADEVQFAWDDGLLAEQSGALPDGTIRTLTWDHEPGSYLPAAQREQRGEADQEYYDARFYAIVADLTGAPSELVAGDGSIAWYQTTDLWGATVDAPESETDCPLRMPGQYHDPETGLDYNHHRYYDPETGTYISGDPLGLGPQPNPRTYVPNPTTGADPLGLAAGQNANQVWNQNVAVHDQSAASWLHSHLDPTAQGRRTTAVVSAVDGGGNLFHYVATSGDRGVAGVIRDQYGPLEDWYRNQGIGGIVWEADPHANPNGGSPHAETNALQDINARGHTPVGGGASRNVCNQCAGYLQGAGASLIGPDFRGGPNTTTKRIFSW